MALPAGVSRDSVRAVYEVLTNGDAAAASHTLMGADGVSRILSAAASTNATVAKASAGYLHQVSGYNAAASARYVKFYNKATAPTVGTDTPVLTYYVPGSGAFVFDIPALYFAAGIGYALTTGGADADTGALTAADILALNVIYG